MLAWIRSPRGSTTTATVVAVVLALFWLAPWQRSLPLKLPSFMGSILPPSGPAATSGGASAPDAPPIAAPPTGQIAATPDRPAAAPSAAAPAAGTTPPAARPKEAGPADAVVGLSPVAPGAVAATPQGAAPSFDIVRVEPTGDAVIAGRAAPGSSVALLDGDKVIAHVTADATGQFALLPDALTAGSHYLTLKTTASDGAETKSAQGVAVSVAKDASVKPLVALLAPDEPAQVLSDGGALAVRGAAGPATPVAIQSVEAGQGGKFNAAGVARPGSQCRVYLNGAYLADVTAGKDGRWSVEVSKGMRPGRYTVRADELEPGTSKVVHRAEVPFDYPVSVAGTAQALLPRSGAGVVPAAEGAGVAAMRPAPAMSGLPSPRPDAKAQTAVAPETGRTASASVTAPASGSDADKGADKATTAPSSPPGTGVAVVPDVSTTTVSRGDSLWRISRKMLGHGIKYTEIYASNASQIKDPRLIYPGQIFVVPSQKPN